MRQAFYCFFIVALISCNEKREHNPPSQSNVKEEVIAMFDQYHAAIEREGLTGEFEYLDRSDDFFWVPPGYESALNYDSVRTILESNAPLFKHVSFHFDTLQIFPLSNEVANYTGIVVGQMTDTAGVNSDVRIIESGTVIKRNDGWKLLSGQSAALPTLEDQ